MMKFSSFLSVVSLVAVSMSASAQSEVFDYNLNVGQFNKLKVLDNINVVYSCEQDSTGMVAYKGEESFNGAFIIENKGGTLKIQAMPEFADREDLPTIYVYSDFLNYAENSSDKLMEITSIAPCAELKVKQVGNGRIVVRDIRATQVKASLATGNGSLVLSGTANKASFSLTGTGTIQADQLKAYDVSCTISGTGSIGCWAENLLKVKGIGSTTIYYKGNPKIKKSSLGGKLEKIYSE